MAWRYHRVEDIAFRQIADECLLVPVRTDPKQAMAIFSLNPVGATLWEALNVPRTEEELVERTVEAFEVDAQEAQGDVRAFLEQLEQKQLVVREDR
jgi:hypothetical protein